MNNNKLNKWFDNFLDGIVDEQNRLADNFAEEDLELKQQINDEVLIDSIYSVALAVAMLAKVIQEK